MAKNDERSIRCSFCGKHQSRVGRLIAGPDVYICNECVQLCNGILESGYESETYSMDNVDVPDYRVR